jgi:hypothetical protein
MLCNSTHVHNAGRPFPLLRSWSATSTCMKAEGSQYLHALALKATNTYMHKAINASCCWPAQMLHQSNQLHYRAHMKTEIYASPTKAPSTARTVTQLDIASFESQCHSLVPNSNVRPHPNRFQRTLSSRRHPTSSCK